MKKIWKRIMSVLLSVALTLSLTAPAFAAYRDVPASHWAADDIQYVTERGLFNGTGPDAFGPSTEMSRAMLATVLYRYAGSPVVNEVAPYVDVTAGAWYMPGVVWRIRIRYSPARTCPERCSTPMRMSGGLSSVLCSTTSPERWAGPPATQTP